jgi:SAM-dependent methyltransferase
MHERPGRKVHVGLDLVSRRRKAQKIELLLGLDRIDASLRVLEIGCGSGGIAHYFGTRPNFHEVTGVDVVDVRRIREGYRFLLVSGVDLPFRDSSFDVVISNHVIEHVGSVEDQLQHLREIARVMGESAVGYIAVPNRWRLIEAHYRLPLLSVLPPRYASAYMRFFRKGDYYDCEPLGAVEAERLLQLAGLRYRRLGVSALRLTLEIEWPTSLSSKLARRLPSRLIQRFEKWLPTLTYEVGKR